jgi:hypothetical protein
MLKLYRALAKYPMLSLALVLAQSASLFAQRSALAELTPGSVVVPAETTKIAAASLDPLPPAPGYETLVARLTILPAAGAEPFAIVAAPIDAQPKAKESHRFWDRENRVLFAAVGAAATADFFTTHSNLASGGRELNPITRVFAGNTATLATNFGLETAGMIGISYLFHKTGHHRLERIASFVNIGTSTGAVTYNLTHR